jgi:hypothetical protein
MRIAQMGRSPDVSDSKDKTMRGKQRVSYWGKPIFLGVPLWLCVMNGCAILASIFMIGGALLYNALREDRSEERTANGPPPKRPQLPEGWVDFQHPKKLYSVYLPGTPSSIPSNGVSPLRNPASPGMSVEEAYTASSLGGNRIMTCGISIFPVPSGGLREVQTGLGSQGAFPGMTLTKTELKWTGRPAVEITIETDLSKALNALPAGFPKPPSMPPGGAANFPAKTKSHHRFIIVNNKLFHFEINCVSGELSDTEKAAFFDSVTFG